MKFGEITMGGKLAGWTLVNKPVTELPQDLASATSEGSDLFKSKLGATYEPVWYLATQVVNGVNHLLICKQTKKTQEESVHIVGVVVNIPIGDLTGKNAKIVEVITDEELIEGVSPDEEVLENFKKATQQLLGFTFTPVLFAGQQVVRGINYTVISEVKTARGGSDPYAAAITFNVFNGEVLVVEVVPLIPAMTSVSDTGEQKPKLGYAFTWLGKQWP